MSILLNMLPLRAGGGLQVGLDFLSSLANSSNATNWSIVYEAGGLLDEAIPPGIGMRMPVDVGPLKRLHWETRRIPRLADRYHDVVYTLFGRGVGRTHKAPSVVGSAYSNIYYPEIDFWRGHSTSRRLLAIAKDRVRRVHTLRADGWIFETSELADRARTLFGLPSERVTVIPPTLSSAFRNGPSETNEASQMKACDFSILLVTSWNPNKNLEILPDVLDALRERQPGAEVSVTVTVDPFDERSVSLLQRASALGVEKSLNLIGPVDQTRCRSLYLRSDCVLLLSELESFSNNVLEAWDTGCVVVISDREWARSACGDAALYVDRDSPSDIAKSLSRVMIDNELYQSLCREGKARLAQLPTSRERLDAITGFLDSVTRLGKLN